MSFLRHGESIARWARPEQNRGSARRTAPGLVDTMSFQLAMPRRVALPQSLTPLRRLRLIMKQEEAAVRSKCSKQ